MFNTATEALDKNMEAIQRMRFESMAVEFIHKWAPKDPHESAQFNAELFSLVRTMFIDVQKPVQDTLVAILGTLPQNGLFK